MTNIITNFRVKTGKPLDEKFGPYLSIEEANLTIPLAERYNGLVFGVYTHPNNVINSYVIEYYYHTNLLDTSIRIKYNIIISNTPPENPNINDIWISI